MSDDLVARLREKARSKQTYGGVTLREAADALEAKGKRIDALESRLIHKYIRIAELKAALKPFEEKFSKSLADAEKLAANEGYELPDDQTAEDIYAWALALTWGDLRAARAALNAES
jgi:hypothetical protein